ncbi:TolC family protein [Methylophilus sp.]|uniref:TolC family protein n=1 Tax=Methylophilus sp. TaxID=29541 RepID=UPI0011D4200F|nr:TolC family protein [Methylophilus sp.]TXI45064.1 MAG: TolC family protein [Methylophilus sp.]
MSVSWRQIVGLCCALSGALPMNALALQLTDFTEFQGRVAGSPAKEMLTPAEDSALAPCAAGLPQRQLTLLDVVEQALCNSPRSTEAWSVAKAQAAQVAVQKSNYLPRVNVTAGAAKVRNHVENSLFSSLDQDNNITNRTASLRLSWLLADLGQRSAKLGQAQALLSAANAAHDATLQEVFITAAQAYFDNLTTQATLTAFEDAESLAKESLAAATAKFQAGVGLLTDQLQAQTAYAQARLDRIKAEGDLKNAHGTLSAAMGLMANTPFQLLKRSQSLDQGDFVHRVDVLIQQATESHPVIVAAKAKVLAAEENIKAVRAEGLPTLNLNTELSRSDQMGYQQLANFPASNVYSTSVNIGLQLNVPLFEGFSRSYQVQSAEAERQTRVAELNRALQQVSLEVWKSYHALMSERENLRATDELTRHAQEAFNVAQGRYQAGVGNMIELLGAQNALSGARQQHIKSLAALRAARLKLSANMGNVGLWAIVEP